MPRPVYVIMAQGVSQDRDTNLVSIFTAIERYSLELAPPGEQMNRALNVGEMPIPVTEHRVIAVWVKDVGDEGVEFEHEFVQIVDGQESTLGRNVFTYEGETFLNRFILVLRGVPVPRQSGFVYIRSRIRGIGANVWSHHDYPLYVDVAVAQPANVRAAIGAAEG